MVNILTIDLEDYFMVSAFEGVVKREDWDKYESRIERNTHRLLDILNGSIRNPQSAILCGPPSSALAGWPNTIH
jgi:hypothetical protein